MKPLSLNIQEQNKLFSPKQMRVITIVGFIFAIIFSIWTTVGIETIIDRIHVDIQKTSPGKKIAYSAISIANYADDGTVMSADPLTSIELKELRGTPSWNGK